MTSRAARGLPGPAASRRERLGRERTAAQLRRQARLEVEVVEQLGPTLGPAGRPMGEAAMALWRRRRVDAYLSLPPWRRAWRTWVSWSRVQRGVTVLALAALWTVVCLPLRMLTLASLEVSQIGVAAIAAAAPLAAIAPPRARGRFVDPLPDGPGAPWHGSRSARAAARGLLAAGVLVVAVLVILAVVGPGPAAPPAGRETPAARHAGAFAARSAVDAACGMPVAGRVTPVGDRRYAVAIEGGGTATVALRAVGFTSTGPRAEVVGAVPCPAP